VTGAIWGKATWGKWWDWDPRLTTTAILFVIYAGYLLLRQSLVDRQRRARLSAVFGIIGFLNVPVVHFSVLWWRGLHQPPTIIRPGDPTIDHLLLAELLASVASFTLAYLWLLRRRVDLEEARDTAEMALEPAR
jgi:heme exporter protein C